MAKYNVKREPVIKTITTHQGGTGYSQKPESELIGILATGMGNNFYEKESEREKRFMELIRQVAKKDKVFAAKALVYARSVFGQRSVTHFGAVELIPFLQGDALGKRFFSKRDKKAQKGGIIWRLDDMAEILAAYLAKNKIGAGDKWTMPNSIKKGFKDAIENADTYELAKYQMKSRGVSLVDIVNLVHPSETQKNGFVTISAEDYSKAVSGTKFEKISVSIEEGKVKIPALRALIIGVLKQFNTVEDKNSDAGKVVAEKVKSGIISKEDAATELNEMKTDNFSELIKTKKIGYLALLRNLRNIIKTGDSTLLDEACELIVNKDFIRKSLVWPHQIDLAMEIMLIEFSGKNLQKVTKALDIAYENSIPNLENLLPEGRTAVVFDTSGSMEGGYGSKMSIEYNGKPHPLNSTPAKKAALIAATFAKGTGGDVYHFGTECKRIRGFNPNDSINTLKREFESHNGECGHGTYYQNIMPTLSREGGHYDRVLIITDEQGADSFERSYNEYSKQYGTPYVYFINVCGYGPTMAKAGNRVFRLFGYSADIYDKIPKLEMNINEVIDAINRIEI